MTFDYPVIIALSVFVIVYIIIATEKLHKTTIALMGASLIIILGIINQQEALTFIDFNTIGLLLGMMILVTIIRQTGLFEYIAIKQAEFCKGSPTKILISFMIVTAILSAFLDNVTTIIVMIPITLNIARVIGVTPVPYVIAEIFASNVGGTATLIGDPPNIMIGSATHLTFSDFIFNLGPIVIITLIITITAFRIIYNKELKTNKSVEVLLELDRKDIITDNVLLIKSLIIMGLVIIAMFLHGFLNFEVATIAIAGAATLLVIGKINIEKVLNEVEWTTIFFFVGIFILAGALEKVGILESLARFTFEITKGNILLTGLAILWISALASAFVDNIPFVGTMIPMIHSFAQLSGNVNVDFLWWCLALGACFGGNGTIVGASANVIGIDIFKRGGYNISFKDFFKIAFPMMLLTMIVATLYVVLFLNSH